MSAHEQLYGSDQNGFVWGFVFRPGIQPFGVRKCRQWRPGNDRRIKIDQRAKCQARAFAQSSVWA